MPGLSVVKGTSRPWWFAPFAVIMGLIGLAGTFVAYDALQSYQPDKSTGTKAVGAVVAAIAALLGVGTLTKKGVEIDSEGIAMRTGWGKTTRIQWSDAHHLYCEVGDRAGAAAIQHVSLRTPDGRQIDVPRIAVAGNPNAHVPRLVEQWSTAAQWPKIQARISDGESVAFGPISVSRESIRIGEREFPMDSRLSLQVEHGKLKIGAQGGWIDSDVLVQDIANWECLLRAIGQITQAEPPG